MDFRKLSKRVPAGVLVMTLFAQMIAPSVFAANTHSIDLESSSSQYLSISDGSQSGLDLTGDLTIESWVKFESLPVDSGYFIAGKHDADGQRAYSFYYEHGASTYKFVLATSDSGTSATEGILTYSALNLGQWYHVAVTKKGTLATFYIDGERVGTATVTSSIFNSSAPFAIGARIDGGPVGYFDGKIDDVRVWNVGRTSTEIQNNFRSELVGDENGLVGYWKLNNSLSDETTNNNDLTNNNSASFSSDVHFVDDLTNRKSGDESVVNSTVLQDDNHLNVKLYANKTYIVDGVIFVTSTSAIPNLRLGLFADVSATIRVGASNNSNEMMLVENTTSSPLSIPAGSAIPVRLQGTIEVGSSDGTVTLKWAQAISDSASVSVLEGGYLRAQEID